MGYQVRQFGWSQFLTVRALQSLNPLQAPPLDPFSIYSLFPEPALAGDVSSCDNPSGKEPSGANRDLNTDSKSGEDTRSDSSSRIVNGSDCKKDAQPWQGALLLGPNKLYCGAVLISPQWLLTAAHCRKP